ncbi:MULTISPECIES: TetR/AcrR family transcriptional regulator [Rhizobium]|uniref:TetR family transcriptional regulator n=1 Tax=Rhizobium favelukesii TaxID=348824 RepID=W6RQ16_9HYPH|nr:MULTISPECIES: TetR/AcrR family transcriptional regulator [Rhizobium]MCA0801328.1 TetR/AcrR family transcriptional regulator [Rhizobium sp. T1473]MCS0457796.1 TetR/AcrR family transcriptional regulator [Rhizobium favelukesii]UFS80444.1 TetR/AcrR family transcriptional regulator [Rhizobium sp. T136]CDM62280.1 TetR family transcriptional regulator [Rhizobium favelukesii]
MAEVENPKTAAAAEGRLGGALLQGEFSDRHRDILEAAASLFAERGYSATSVRDIGERVGLLGGSLYHYIKSKEALFVRIHDIALQVAEDRILAAVSGLTDPWARLEAACVTMLEIQLDPNSLTMPLMNDFASAPLEIRERLVAKRDAFEQMFRDLIADLSLHPAFDRGVYRLLLLTLLNNVGSWYRPGDMTPEDIGLQIVRIFRHDEICANDG